MNHRNRLRKLNLENLERRSLLSALSSIEETPLLVGPLQPTVAVIAQDVPVLHSNPSAVDKVFLDFDGNFLASWGGRTNIITPAYQGNADNISEIWSRVAEDYSIFNVDVTTADPGAGYAKQVHVLIGGSYSDWYGGAAGGVGYVGGYYNLSPNEVFVFANNLGNYPKYVAEAASHEAGHAFGLQHQAAWSGNTLVSEYSQGSGDWAPIMGVGYYANRTTFYNGPTAAGPNSSQDDIGILGGPFDGFGKRPDDYVGTVALNNSTFSVTGIVGVNDTDTFQFNTASGVLNINLNGADIGNNTDLILDLYDSTNNLVLESAPTDSYDAVINTTVLPGTYTLVVRTAGNYGNVGQYTLSGTYDNAVVNPNLLVVTGNTQVNSGDTFNYGSTQAGTFVDKTFTIDNIGNGVLNISGVTVPAGFTILVAPSSTIAPGGSSDLTVRLNGSDGTYSGPVAITSNDTDTPVFTFNVSGQVLAPHIAVSNNGTAIANNGSLDFGSVDIGGNIDKTITINNTGSGNLNISGVTVPTGYTILVSPSSTIAAGSSSDLTLRMSGNSGTYSGSVVISSNDANTPFTVNVSGQVLASHIVVSSNGTAIANNGSLDFGSVYFGGSVDKTFTINNTGNGTLTLSNIAVSSVFSIVSAPSSTIAPGGSSDFVVRLSGNSGLYSGSVVITSNDTTTPVFTVNVSGSILASHIELSSNGTAIANNGTLDFGSANFGGIVNKTITIKNTGTGDLTITPNIPTGSYTLVSSVSTISPGSQADITIISNANIIGQLNSVLTIASNDPAVAVFSVNLTMVSLGDTTQTIDDGDAGFSTTGTWTTLTNRGGYQNDVKISNTVATATWAFTGLSNGTYGVYAEYNDVKNVRQSNSALYTIDVPDVMTNVTVNQNAKPKDLFEDKLYWKRLAIVTVTDGTMTVKLTSTPSDSYVIADAIRIKSMNQLATPIVSSDCNLPLV